MLNAITLAEMTLFKISRFKQQFNSQITMQLIKRAIPYLIKTLNENKRGITPCPTFKTLVTGVLFFQFFKRLFMLIPQTKTIDHVTLNLSTYPAKLLI